MNNPIDNLIDRYAGQVQIAGRTFGLAAQAYAERILARLDAIHQAVQSEEFEERHWTVRKSMAQDVITEILEVKPGHEYALTGVGVLGAATITVNEGGEVVFTKQYNEADTAYPIGCILHGGAQVTAVLDGNADPVRVFLQFAERERVARRSPAGSGRVELPPDRGDAKGRQDVEGRHSVG